MAYNHPQGSNQPSWSQEDARNQCSTLFFQPIGGSSEAEQSHGTSPTSLGGVANTQHWDFEPSTYAPVYGTYHSHNNNNNNNQQPMQGQNILGSSTLQGGNYSAPGSTRSPVTHYTPLQPYPSQLHHVPAYPAGGPNMSQAYSVVTAAEFNLQFASVVPVHSPRNLRTRVDAEYSVPCPYRCATVLTGVHALGNLTRHLKTQACAGSSRAKVRYPCPIEGCGRQYARSDGLRVHMRRRHGTPPAGGEN